MPNYAPLWYWVKEREAIRIKKTLFSPPWTDDPILAKYRFCCVRREDDRVTKWIRENIREPFKDSPYLWYMLCIARQINWPETLAELIAGKAWPTDDAFKPKDMTEALNVRKQRGDKIYTGAYMISAPPVKGADKQAYISEEVCGSLWKNRATFEKLFENKKCGIYDVHSTLSSFNGWGNFMAYQAVVDMRFTRLLCQAPDRDSWAAAGPGTLRGLNRIHERPLNKKIEQYHARQEMREIFKHVTNETGVHMDFSDVPNILCETDKYLRVKNGEGTPRALYVPNRGS